MKTDNPTLDDVIAAFQQAPRTTQEEILDAIASIKEGAERLKRNKRTATREAQKEAT